MDTISAVILLLIMLFLSAIFSGMEIAFITSDRVRVELDIKQGGMIGSILNRFYKNSSFFISTILVGNNITLVVYGLAAAVILEPILEKYIVSDALNLIVSTLITTGVILLMGEFIPKTVFRINPNSSLKFFAPPIFLIYLVLYPVSLLTTGISRLLMKIAGIKDNQTSLGYLSIGDLNEFIERTIEQNPQQEQELENEVKIFHNALDFSSIHLRDCMIPRNEIIAVDIDDITTEQLSALFTSSGRSKIIVYKEDIDNILGYIHVSELFHPERKWQDNIKPIIYAPEALLANKMMRRLLTEKRSIAIIIDEFGGTAGMVTLEDLVEEIFGDIQDEHDHSKLIQKEVSPGVYEFSGRSEIEHINESFGLDIPESDEYQTLAGYIFITTGSIPEQGDEIAIGNLLFTIVKRNATRLELIRVTANSTSKDKD